MDTQTNVMIDSNSKRPNFLDSLILPLFGAILMWTIHIISAVSNLELYYLGIFPRHLSGLIGILTSPFIHGDFQHLASNTIPFIFLSWMITYFYKDVAIKSIFLIYILTGVAVWCFAREVYHIGASGVVYGLVAFVFWSGIFVKDIRSIVLSLIVVLLYSGMFLGIVPNQEGVSWESHLYGGLMGILTAFIVKSEIVPEEKYENWEEPETEKNYFLPRDTFEQTKAERAQNNWDWNSDRT
jgi:membrane associated rhomboid family serine protease